MLWGFEHILLLPSCARTPIFLLPALTPPPLTTFYTKFYYMLWPATDCNPLSIKYCQLLPTPCSKTLIVASGSVGCTHVKLMFQGYILANSGSFSFFRYIMCSLISLVVARFLNYDVYARLLLFAWLFPVVSGKCLGYFRCLFI